MTILNMRHTTVYRYRRPVRLGDHRLMLRPRDANLIRVAVTRDISQAVPISGSFVGGSDDYLGMTVDVAVILEQGAAARSV
jgi:Bacterial transglutaminase-like N-terminal region